MVAPIDAKAIIQAGDEQITLQLNFRTLALAKAGGVNLLGGADLGAMDPLDLAVLVRAFATPAHPDMTEDQALALLIRHGSACTAAITELAQHFAGSAEAAADADPTKRAGRARTKATR